MRHYCSLWDSKYAAKGLAMYESLKRHSSDSFKLYILPLDDEAADALIVMKPGPDIWIMPHWDLWVRAEGLEEIRKSRTQQEWCWTCASQFCDYLLRRHSEVTYLDADLFFFSDPKPIHDEIGARSIGIIPHRFISSKQYLEVNGQFNVGWVTFKNTDAGRACLSRWAAQVRERCDASTCGDQKYLDEWPSLYGDEVSIIQNIGANVAPWNVGNYRVTAIETTHALSQGPEYKWPTVDGHLIVFYHYHEYEHGKRLTNYELRSEEIEFIYKPYIAAIDEATKQIETVHLSA